MEVDEKTWAKMRNDNVKCLTGMTGYKIIKKKGFLSNKLQK